jgi:hypothetical protein
MRTQFHATPRLRTAEEVEVVEEEGLLEEQHVLVNAKNKTNNDQYYPFLGTLNRSLRPSDTVTESKAHACREMGTLLHSCYIM